MQEWNKNKHRRSDVQTKKEVLELKMINSIKRNRRYRDFLMYRKHNLDKESRTGWGFGGLRGGWGGRKRTL